MKKISPIYLILFFTFFPVNSYSESEFYIPNTISQDAQEIIKSFKRSSREWPKQNDKDGWRIIKEKYNSYVKEINEKVLKEFSPTIKDGEINNIPVLYITPKNPRNDGIIVYVHGGAFTLFDAKSSLYNIVPLSNYSKTKVISIDYTTAPSKKWNQILDEIVTVTSALIKKHKNKKIILLGDSAGGALATSAVLKMKSMKLRTPSALILWSPWSDITETGDTYITLKDAETSFTYDSLLYHAAQAYADSVDQKNPYVSPVYGHFDKDFPPTLIQGGTKELFMSNFIRLYQAIDQAGGDVTLDLYEGMWHVFQSYWNIPESKIALGKSVKFIDTYLRKSK